MSNNIHNNNSHLLNISYDEWNTYLQYNKQIIINKIDNTLLIDKSQEYKHFIIILHNMFNINIFDLSRISYLIFNVLHIYINKYLPSIVINQQHQDLTKSARAHIPDLTSNSNSNSNSFIVLQLIIQLIINIECILNTQLLLIIYILHKNINTHTDTNTNTNTDTKVRAANNNVLPETYLSATTSTPNILLIMYKLCNNINSNIKPSIVILLLLKLNSQLCNYNIIDILNNNILDINILDNNIFNTKINEDEDILSTTNNYQKSKIKSKFIIQKLNILLDNFIINMSMSMNMNMNMNMSMQNHQHHHHQHQHQHQHQNNQHQHHHHQHQHNHQHELRTPVNNTSQHTFKNIIDKYKIFVDYIIDITTVLYIIFDKLFDTFLNYIKIEYDDNTNFDVIKTQITTLLQNEIIQLKTKLLDTSINSNISSNISSSISNINT